MAQTGTYLSSLLDQHQSAAVTTSQKPFPVQVDLGGFSYYTTQVPFKDLMFQQSRWATTTNPYGATCNSAGIPTDAAGYPTVSLKGTGCAYYNWVMLHVAATPAPYKWPPGHYVLTYMGTGTISISAIATNRKNVAPGRIEFDVAIPGDLFTITILDTDPNDHLRDMHIFLASDESTYQTQPFQQAFLNQLAPYDILRFMDWAGVSLKTLPSPRSFTSGLTLVDPSTIILPSTAPATDDFYKDMVLVINIGSQWPRVFVSSYDGATRTLHLTSPLPTGTLSGVYPEDYVNKHWNERTGLGTHEQQTTKGVAIEYMIKLANVTHKDMWINVPTAADDNFVYQMAALIKNTLDPSLKVYIEYSNETWNTGYPGYDYSEAMYRKGVVPFADAWQPYRALQIFHIFNQAFGQPDLRKDRNPSSDRLVRILTGQTAWLGRSVKQMDFVMPNNAAPTYGHYAYEYADEWAVTDYFGLPSTAPSKDLSTYTIDQLIDLQKQSVGELVAPGAVTASSPNWIYKLVLEAQKRGLVLGQYEGGVGFDVPNGDQAIVNKLTAMNRDPRMRDVYDEYFKQWVTLSQAFPGVIGNIAIFTDVGTYSKYGFWGMLESSLQNPSSVPRYQGLLDYINGTLYTNSGAQSNPSSTSSSNSSSSSNTSQTSSSNTAGNDTQSTSNSSNSSSGISSTGINLASLPTKVIRTAIKVAADLNPELSCSILFVFPTDIADCNDYIGHVLQYNWIAADSVVQPATQSSTTATSSTSVAAPPAAPTRGTVTQYLTATAGPGRSGGAVESVQRFLVASGVLTMPSDAPLGYYGSLTQQAVAQFQQQQGLVQDGTPATTGFGAVGPKTLQAINAYLTANPSLVQKMQAVVGAAPTSSGSVSSPVATPKTTQPLPSAKPTCAANKTPKGGDLLTLDLSLGDCSSEVVTLQEMLNSVGFTVANTGEGSHGHESVYFGATTKAAVAKLQATLNVTADKSGAVGAATRAKLIEVFRAGARY